MQAFSLETAKQTLCFKAYCFPKAAGSAAPFSLIFGRDHLLIETKEVLVSE